MNLTKTIFDFFFERERGVVKLLQRCPMWPGASIDLYQQGERTSGDYTSQHAVLLNVMLEPAASGVPSLYITDAGGCHLLKFTSISSPWGSWKIASAITGLHSLDVPSL